MTVISVKINQLGVGQLSESIRVLVGLQLLGRLEEMVGLLVGINNVAMPQNISVNNPCNLKKDHCIID